jgi:hypothetical protein
MIRINGRGRKKPRLTIKATSGGILLQVVDDELLDFWLEVSVSRVDLLAWVALVNLAHTYCPGTGVEMAYPLSGEFIPEEDAQ